MLRLGFRFEEGHEGMPSKAPADNTKRIHSAGTVAQEDLNQIVAASHILLNDPERVEH